MSFPINCFLFCLITINGLTFNTVLAASSSELLKEGEIFEFNSRDSSHIGLLNRLDWYEKNERSTSRNYTFWDDADVYLLEWPGNITRFDHLNPLVKWGRTRAKYIEDPCALELGIEMRAYAFNYVYLTWGSYRLTKTYTMPLSVPRSILASTTLARLSQRFSYEENKLNTVVVYDMAFAHDALLLAFEDGVIRVSGLEMAYAELGTTSKTPLTYTKARGLHGLVDKILVQGCCLKSYFCAFGDFVVAYGEHSVSSSIFISNDGGKSFKQLKPELPRTASLKVILPYPEYNELISLYEFGKKIWMSRTDVNGKSLASDTELSLTVQGNLRGSRLGLESSYVLWDNCSVWYSPDSESNLTKSVLYIHKRIRSDKVRNLHLMTKEHCNFNENSILAYSQSGKFVIVDGNNTVFFGIDTKTNISQLIALNADMSLLIPGKELSVTPSFEITSDQPKLIYPPKYLELPEKFRLGKSYERRLGMRVLPKNLYPSDYITAFFDENVRDQEAKKRFSLKACQTSSLEVNNSITQKRKFYFASPSSVVNFTIGFTSKIKKIRQLYFEPAKVLEYVSLKMFPMSIDELGIDDVRYIMKYRVMISPKKTAKMNELVRITFFTRQDLRCNFPPRVPVYIKLENKPATNPEILSDDDMTRPVYLKSVTDGETTYIHKGEPLDSSRRILTCPSPKRMSE